MPKQKTLAELNAEKENIERQLAQEQHKIQRLKNRAAYYEKGERRKRAHRLITRGAAVESDEKFERNRVLRFCRTGFRPARRTKAAHGCCQQPYGR